MTLYYGEPDAAIRLYHAECVAWMGTQAENSVDAVVTDPPYHLNQGSRKGDKGFMGQTWDGGNIAFNVGTWRAALHCLKPGGHLISFGGTRTWHRLACALEDAGFELRDTLCWLYGSGFPKSHNIYKALNGHKDAEQYRGFGSALKPAFEPIILARKPLQGTLAQNVLGWGTGGLNIAACRIHASEVLSGGGGKLWSHYRDGTEDRAAPQINNGMGRWPANVLLDEEAAALLDQQAGERTSRPGATKRNGHRVNCYGVYGAQPDGIKYPGDAANASRFFYVAKASRRERGDANTHPTVKPLALMRHLVRLVTPPKGLILDPFAGCRGLQVYRRGAG